MRQTRTIQYQVEPIRIGDATTVLDVLQELNRRLAPLFDESDYSLRPSVSRDREALGEEPWLVARGQYRQLAVYQAEGTSEGHYVSIVFLMHKDDRGVNSTYRLVAACKTFGGLEHAQAIQDATQFLLQDA